ncbi:hypothetical protein A3K63_04805 [Candidatus Micrarchaeota archaeon RBG_16_49_10]|nr:MAG: hypothetical protein A3K63_04805 [Candidatus Micrarchaeota archaeon RBG_16_49_10]
MSFYAKFYWLMPKGYRRWLADKLRCGGMKAKPEEYGGFAIFFSIILGLTVFTMALFFELETKLAIAAGFGMFIVFQFLSMSSVVMAVDRRAKHTEEILPDALILMSSNIKSGLTPDRALLMSARDEFGPFGEELRKAAKQVIAGKNLEEAMKEIPKNIESRILKRTVDLLEEGIKQGGNLVNLLDTLANDIRQTKILRKEVSSFVLMYVIFIFFAVGIGAPLLFAISSYLVRTMAEISGALNVGDSVAVSGSRMMKFQITSIDSSFLMLYSVLALSVNSIFGGILIGVVQEGTAKGGLKYIPMLLLVSISIYFATRYAVMNALAIF